MDPIIDEILVGLLEKVAEGYGNIKDMAWRLLGILAILEIGFASLWWMFGSDDMMQEFLKIIIKIGFYVFLILQFAVYMPEIIGGFIYVGHVAGGGSGYDQTGELTFFSPDAIIIKGLSVGLTMVINALIGIYTVAYVLPIFLVPIVIYIVAGFFILISFISMGISVALAFIEFYILAVLSVILLPFGVFQHTYFIAEKIFTMVMANGLKIMVMTFILTITPDIFNGHISLEGGLMTSGPEAITALIEMLDIFKVVKLMIFTWLFSKIVNNIPELAKGLLGEGPSMNQSADDTVKTIKSAGKTAGAVASGVASGGMSASAVFQAVHKGAVGSEDE